MRGVFASIFILFMLSMNVGAAIHEEYSQENQTAEDMRVAGVLIVSFAPQIECEAIKSVNGRIFTGSPELDNILLRYNVQKIEKLFATAKPSLTAEAGHNLSRYYRIEFPPQFELDDFMQELSELPGIESVEPVGIHPVMVTPNDNSYSSQWHHY